MGPYRAMEHPTVPASFARTELAKVNFSQSCNAPIELSADYVQ